MHRFSPTNFARRDFQIEGTRGLHGDTCTADECCLARFQAGTGNKTPIHKALRTALPFPRFENVPINATRKFAGGPKCPHFYNSRAGQMATESVPPHIFYKMRPQQSSFCGLSTRLPWPSMTSDLAPATPIPLLCATSHNARAAFCRKDNQLHQLNAPDHPEDRIMDERSETNWRSLYRPDRIRQVALGVLPRRP